MFYVFQIMPLCKNNGWGNNQNTYLTTSANYDVTNKEF